MGDQKSSNTAINPDCRFADAQQHCVAVIKQEVRDDEDEMPHETPANLSTKPSNVSSKYKEHFRQQQEEIVNRLHKAVSDNLKLMNQGNSGEVCNGNNSAFAANKPDDLCSNRNLNMSSMNSSRFARSFNGNSSEMKTCRLNNNSSSKSKLSLSVAQQLHSNIPNDLFSSLIDNDDNNNNNNSNLLHEDNNGDGNYLLPCPLCEIPLEPRVFRQHLDRHYPRDSPICPVLQCGRRFAHPNSVRNHMRLKHTVQWNRMKSMRSSGGPFSSIPY
jgi:hypothetical protein